MIKVGITGGIGSGKTTVSRILESFNYPVFYADLRARWITENDPKVIAQVKQLFDEDVYDRHNVLNRAKVADLVFKNAKILKQLNNIIHPAVAHDFKEWCENQNSDMLFKEAAILFESGANKTLQKIICISAPEETRIERIIQRDGFSKFQVKERLNNQMSDKERIKLSDFVINNDGKQFVLPQLQNILQQLK